MSDTTQTGGERRGSVFGRLKDLIEFIQVAAVIVIAVMVYFRPESPGSGTEQDKDKDCRSGYVAALLAGPWNTMIPPELAANVRKYLNRCEKDPDARYVMEAVSEAAKDPRMALLAAQGIPTAGPTATVVKSSSGGGLTLGPTVPAAEAGVLADREVAGPTASPPAKPPTSGWVAVGFVGDEALFDLPPGRTLQTLVAGDELTAKRPVNLRKKAADWTGAIGAVPAARKVKIVEAPKTLVAGSLTQVWARVELP